MSELDDRYELGQETRRMFGGGQITGGSSPGAWDIAPDLERILGEGLFRNHLATTGADAGAARDDYPLVADCAEPGSATAAAPGQRPEHRVDAGTDC